jgi:hypothetical protein
LIQTLVVPACFPSLRNVVVHRCADHDVMDLSPVLASVIVAPVDTGCAAHYHLRASGTKAVQNEPWTAWRIQAHNAKR